MCDPCITAAYYFAVDLTHHRRCIFQTTVYGLRFSIFRMDSGLGTVPGR